MKEKLNSLIKGDLYTIDIFNILINEHSKDYYKLLGDYIVKKLDVSKIPMLKIVSESSKKRNFSQSLAIFFNTSVLDADALRKIFGEPIYHNEFGEGFEGEYDAEIDEYSEPEIKELYASYVVEIDGINFHIGYDHRGTSIEMEIQKPIKNYNIDEISTKENAKKCLDCLKKLVDLYKENVN